MNRFALVGLAAVLPAAVNTAHATDVVQPSFIAPAVSLLSGYIDIYGGAGWTRVGSDRDTFGVFGGNAAANYWHTPSSSFQLDLNSEISTNLPNCCGDNRLYGSVAVHWSMRDPSSHLIGVFGGVNGTNGADYYNSQAQGILGVEGQLYHGDWTFYGQAGVLREIISSSDSGADVGFARLVVRLFPTQTSKLQGEIGFAATRFSYDGDHGNIVTWGASYERQLAMAPPVSLYVDYSAADLRNPHDGYHIVDQDLVGGLRLRFGQTTLFGNDRSGATVDLPNTLLRVQTWNGWLY